MNKAWGMAIKYWIRLENGTANTFLKMKLILRPNVTNIAGFRVYSTSYAKTDLEICGLTIRYMTTGYFTNIFYKG